jgi:transposase
MAEKARMIQRCFENIVPQPRQRITNAASELSKSRIQWVKYTARGFRKARNFVTVIYFHCGCLDLTHATY